MRLRHLPAAALALLVGCAVMPPQNPDCVALPASNGSYCLQPSSGVAPFNALQTVDATFRGKQENMIVSLEVDRNGMRFAALTPFGQKLLEANYDNRAVYAASSALPGSKLDPKLVLALLQLALWPAAHVRTGLSGGMELKDDGTRRTVAAGAKRLLLIRHRGNAPPYRQLEIEAPAAGLILAIKTLQGKRGPTP